jgi:transcriptional regulator with XRE-family HTH domain
MVDAKRVGKRIRQLRDERHITQEKLAYECGRSKSFLCEIEAGKKLPSLKVLSELAERLDVPVFDLLVFPENPRTWLIDATRALPDAAIADLLARARPAAEK